jgi:ATP-dependent DNA helicase DinG
MDIREVFSEQGPVAKALENFERRDEQMRMALAVEDSLAKDRNLIVEAGTGVGKSLAYLVPLADWVLSEDGRKAVVSTYTKTLQKQLIDKELPFLKENMFENLRFALCLGSENYLCLRRLDQASTLGLFDTGETADIRRLLRWVKRTDTGIRQDIDVPPQLWQKVCRESDICYGKDCRRYPECFFQIARSVERKAHILVTNHHLFFANVASGWKVIPPFECVVFDEAHELEDVAADYLGVEISNFRLRHLLDSILSPAGRGLLIRLKWLDQSAFSEISSLVNHARTSGDVFFQELAERLSGMSTIRIRERGFQKDILSDVLGQLDQELELLRESSIDEEEIREITALGLRCRGFSVSMQAILEQDLENHVYWAERDGKRLRLVSTPVDVASILKAQVYESISPVILTSATLSANGSFEYIKERIGLPDPETLLLHSPFNYRTQALLYIPDDIRGSGDAGFEEDVSFFIQKILEITRGRTLVLFTSHRLLKKAYDASEAHELELLRQGDMDSYRLIQEFRNSRNAALFGTYTFWQGIDIPGDDLQCVIITKLPFAVPDAPVIEARMEAIERDGKNPFNHYQVPQAIILLKQGFGRLIRAKTDRGVVVILDSRIWKKSYGKLFLRSLPDCPVVKSLGAVAEFFSEVRGDSGCRTPDAA